MKFSALAIAGFISLVSAQAESTVVVHATYTDVVSLYPDQDHHLLLWR